MSTLGKIVTVFIVVASVALAALVVAFVQQTPDWHAVVLQQQEVITKAAQAREALKDAIVSRNEELVRLEQRALLRRDSLASQIQTLETAKADLERQIREAQTEIAKLHGAVDGLNESFKVEQARAQNWKDKYDQAIATTESANKDAQALAKDKYDLLRIKAELEKKVRLYEERIVEQEKKLAWLEHNFPGQLPEYQETPTRNLDGVVTAADNTRRVVEISLGSNDGVAKGLTFMVSRGNTYLGDLVITEVDENTAVGTLKTVQGNVEEGDHVTYQFRK